MECKYKGNIINIMPVGCSLLVVQESKGHSHAPLVCHFGSDEVELGEQGRPGVKGAVHENLSGMAHHPGPLVTHENHKQLLNGVLRVQVVTVPLKEN
jgi:hypothetical protein